ncbi:DeoR/GlpR family DNA-binding transcription regulator [Vibrio salinus]|uniref:DeoR/GlpR family DNA-binding transcription regulator n=1 Tax=Vibrio salinus TaxID=2899784 RepID=UPI001E4F2250|nr:DeoR/GlpR family DNA-binding transcription regulator [Vibrio salinus]MCE0494799.1 DeoR/GlpR family DNA-binding transcription regulator [Vibrio salinus]
MHNLSVRQEKILQCINQNEYCTIENLSALFSVTTQTIRRDINQLCTLGLARRHHGGVGLPITLSNRSFLSRQRTSQAEKQQIAEAVARLIPDGSTIFLGIGTTIAFIAEKLLNHKELRVVTNNFEAAYTLSQYNNTEIWLPEGRIRSNDGDIVGESVTNLFSRYFADIGIIGCAAVREYPTGSDIGAPIKETAMEYELREANVSQAILANCQQKWLVANRSKWQRKANAKVAGLDRFDRVFTSD